MKVAIQMDSFASLDKTGDTTLALIAEAKKRGHKLFHYLAENLSLEGNKIYASGHEIKGEKLGKAKRVNLSDYNIVLMRQDPPFNMGYISATYILEKLPKHVLVVNDAAGVRNSPEKLFVMDYPNLMPPTLITRCKKDVVAFHNKHKQIILKPLYGNGGEGVFKVGKGGENLSSLIEMFQKQAEPFIAQKYLSEVKQGDKRIILLNGEPVGAINRLPKKGEVRSNMHVGGRATKATISESDKKICKIIAPELNRRGFIFAGIDIIGNYLTEINITSPTGIVEIKKFSKIDIAKKFWDYVATSRLVVNS